MVYLPQSGTAPVVLFNETVMKIQDQAIKHPESLDNIGRQGADLGQGLSAYHVQGYLWRFCVNKDDEKSSWSVMDTGATREWKLNGEGYISQDSTIYPNWFIACENRCKNDVTDDCCTPATIKSTKSITYNKPDFVAAFDTKEAYLRSDKDKFEPKTPGEIYQDIQNKKANTRIFSLPIIPQPTIVQANPSTNQVPRINKNNFTEVPSAGIKIHKRIWNITFNNMSKNNFSFTLS